MARHHGTKHAGNAWPRLLSGVGVRAGAFVAAAVVAAGSAAPAKADFEDLLGPIVQPILTSLTDSVTLFDPAAALDLTSWTDTLLSSLGSFDLALPTADSAVAAAATGAEPAEAAATYTIPITMQSSPSRPSRPRLPGQTTRCLSTPDPPASSSRGKASDRQTSRLSRIS